MYLITPKFLEFNINEARHTVLIARNWQNRKFNLRDNIKAAVAKTESEGIALILPDIRNLLNNYVEVKQGLVRAEDFTFFYECEEVVNGRVWGGSTTGFSRSKRLLY